MTCPPQRSSVRCLSLAACGVAASLLLVACDDDAIRSYTAPVDAPRPTPPMASLGDPGGAPTGEVDLHWTVPPGWRQADSQQSFTVASFEAGPEDEPITVTLTRLRGEGGGAMQNINRWRGQIGLPPVAELPEQPMERIDAGPFVAGFVDLVGEAGPDGQPARIVGALLPRPEKNETWFFKMMGPRDALEPLKPQLAAMVRSVHPAHGHSHDHAEAPPAAAPGPATGTPDAPQEGSP